MNAKVFIYYPPLSEFQPIPSLAISLVDINKIIQISSSINHFQDMKHSKIVDYGPWTQISETINWTL